MTWQNGRQLREIADTPFGRIQMEYDYLGRRTRKISDQFSAYYFWEGDRLIAEIRGGILIWYLYDANGIMGMNLLGNDYFFERNIFGDVVGVYTSYGRLVATYEYDAWGNHVNPCPHTQWAAFVNPFRWRGKYWDQETNLYYMMSRYYCPQIGRFINADDPRMLFTESFLAPANGANLFMYAYNNPVMFRDDSGYGFLTTLLIAGIIAGAISGAAASPAISGSLTMSPSTGITGHTHMQGGSQSIPTVTSVGFPTNPMVNNIFGFNNRNLNFGAPYLNPTWRPENITELIFGALTYIGMGLAAVGALLVVIGYFLPTGSKPAAILTSAGAVMAVAGIVLVHIFGTSSGAGGIARFLRR